MVLSFFYYIWYYSLSPLTLQTEINYSCDESSRVRIRIAMNWVKQSELKVRRFNKPHVLLIHNILYGSAVNSKQRNTLYNIIILNEWPLLNENTNYWTGCVLHTKHVCNLIQTILFIVLKQFNLFDSFVLVASLFVC